MKLANSLFLIVFVAFSVSQTGDALAGPIILQGSSLKTQLSNLSDGGFERQLDIPLTAPLVPNSPLMIQAIASYDKLPFNMAERLRYVITYLGVQGGDAELLLRTPVQWNQTWAHRITGEVISADWYKWVAKIHDSVEGLMSGAPEFEPHRFYINQKEGDYLQSKIVNFEGPKVGQLTQRKDRPQKHEDFDLAPNTKDALGALYYVRTRLAAEPNLKDFEFPVFTSEKNWTLKVTWLKSEEKRIGKTLFATDVWQLTSHFGGLMEQKGDIRMWLTQDSRRLPVYIEASIKFGALKMHLKDWDPGFQLSATKPKYEKLRLEP
jgi:Protein of unknown function (DUF3108)